MTPAERKAYNAAHYRRNRQKVLARSKIKNPQQRKLLRDYLRELKDGATCLDCLRPYRHYQLEFDHVRGVKASNVADIVSQGLGLRTLIEEIAKCDLVCANCHAARTWNRR